MRPRRRVMAIAASSLMLLIATSCTKRRFQESAGGSTLLETTNSGSAAERQTGLEQGMSQYAIVLSTSDHSPEMLNYDEPPNLTNVIEFNPLPLLPYPNPPPSPVKDIITIPEGMTVFGKLSLDRDTVIHVHGWSPTGKADDFFYADRWHRAGYNTVLLRWHRKSYDPGRMPLDAEQRVWAGDGEFGVQEYKRLLAALGKNYKKKIRMVTHSLGTSMVAYIYASLIAAGEEKLLPKRLDVLDPFVGFWKPFPRQSPLYEALGRPPNMGAAVGNALLETRRKSYSLVNFHAAFIGRLNASNLWNNINVQLYDFRWLGRNIGGMHWETLVGFFRSISQPPPRVAEGAGAGEFALSASTPDDALSGRYPRTFLQISGFDKTDVHEMQFKAEYNAPR